MSHAPLFHGPGQTQVDHPRLLTQLDFLRSYLADGTWRTLPEICAAYKEETNRTMLETSASAGLRSLRHAQHGGFTVERQLYRPGLFAYRIARPARKPLRMLEP